MKFPWKRYWCPLEGEAKFDKAGYLANPEVYGKYLNPDVVSFEKMQNAPCLI